MKLCHMYTYHYNYNDIGLEKTVKLHDKLMINYISKYVLSILLIISHNIDMVNANAVAYNNQSQWTKASTISGVDC